MRIDAILLAALVAALALGAFAQAAPADAEKKAARAPPKATPKAPPKAGLKKARSAKKGTQQVSPNVTVYRDAKDAPVARDKQGNVIPTGPEAYDVSSATKK